LSTNAHFKPLKFKWPLTIREWINVTGSDIS
jgi:hypothetical protein